MTAPTPRSSLQSPPPSCSITMVSSHSSFQLRLHIVPKRHFMIRPECPLLQVRFSSKYQPQCSLKIRVCLPSACHRRYYTSKNQKAHLQTKDYRDIGRSPLGPRVTPTASASLLMPICIFLRDSLSKIISFAEERTWTVARMWDEVQQKP